MGTVEAINALLSLVSTVSTLASHAQAISAVIAKAQSENRTTLTAAEWATVKGADDAARQHLAQAIRSASGA